MKRLAIVSSYDESCGNAYFTDVLINSINAASGDFQAIPVGLNLMLNQNLGRTERSAARREFKNLAEKLSSFDAVNIQFESQLFGIVPKDVRERFLALLDANPNTSVTYHSPRLLGDFVHRKNALRHLLTGRLMGALKEELQNYRQNFDVYLNKELISQIAKRNVPLVVHTKRAKDLISKLFGYENVFCHPLAFTDTPPPNPKKSLIREQLGLPTDKRMMGLFGYLSRYKGILEIVDLVKYLPADIHLVVAGRQHPQSLGNKDSEDYIRSISDLVLKSKKVRERVHFVGELPNEDFESLVANVDLCLLPYHEVGQDGSGIASICFELGQRVLTSNSLAFDELFKLIPEYRSLRFDLNNTSEIIEKIVLSLQKSPMQRAPASYSVVTQRNLYLNLAKG